MDGSDTHDKIIAKDSDRDPVIPFPFEPYGVQKQLMVKIYNTLEHGGVGIFESPTGTVSCGDIPTASLFSSLREW